MQKINISLADRRQNGGDPVSRSASVELKRTKEKTKINKRNKQKK